MSTTTSIHCGLYKRLAPLILGLTGIGVAVAGVTVCFPALEPVTVEKTVVEQRPVFESRTVMKTVTLPDGKQVEVPVEENTPRMLQVDKKAPETIPPTPTEQIWLYGMIIVGAILAITSVGTIGIWFYFVVRSNGSPPPIVTEMMKYFVTSFMGVFVGFLGGSSVGKEKLETIDKPPAVVAPAP